MLFWFGCKGKQQVSSLETYQSKFNRKVVIFPSSILLQLRLVIYWSCLVHYCEYYYEVFTSENTKMSSFGPDTA